MASTMPTPVPPPLEESAGLQKESAALEQDVKELAVAEGAEKQEGTPTHHANGLTDQTSYLPPRCESVEARSGLLIAEGDG